MEMSYLGIFEWVFEMVLQNIVTPVFNFVASLISYGLGWIFENVLGPILLPILQTVMEWSYRLFMYIYSLYYFSWFQLILTFVDYMERAFDIFIGLEPVTYDGKSGTLLEIFLRMPVFQKAFYLIMFSGILIAMLLTIYGVARSAFDLDFENKKPVSHVLTQMFKSLIGALLIPFMVWTLVYITSGILLTLNSAVSLGNANGGEDTSTLGSTLFVLSSTHAAWNSDYNMSSTKRSIDFDKIEIKVEEKRNPNFQLLDPPREKFYYNDKYDNYKNLVKVMFYFDISRIDYEIAFAAIIMLIIMFMCLMTFIRRLFEILLLYLASPYFVAMIPLDDGAKFKNWLGMFTGRLVTGYGSVVVMKIYLMLCPMFARGNIVTENSGPEMQYLLKGVFLLGGGWAVLKSGNLLTEIVNQSSARAEQASMRSGMGLLRKAADIATTPVQTAYSLAKQIAMEDIKDKFKGSRGGGGDGGGRNFGSAGAKNTAGKKLTPPNKPLPPTPGKHRPPNKPLPPTPGKHRPPNKPLPPTPGKRVAPNKPLPPIPGKRVAPNKPLPPTPGRPTAPNKPLPPIPGRPTAPNKPLPPTPGRPTAPNKPLPPTPGRPTAPNKPLPPTPGGYTSQAQQGRPSGQGGLQGSGSSLRDRLSESRTIERAPSENRAPTVSSSTISSSFHSHQGNTYQPSGGGSQSAGPSVGMGANAELAREKMNKRTDKAKTKAKHDGKEDK